MSLEISDVLSSAVSTYRHHSQSLNSERYTDVVLDYLKAPRLDFLAALAIDNKGQRVTWKYTRCLPDKEVFGNIWHVLLHLVDALEYVFVIFVGITCGFGLTKKLIWWMGDRSVNTKNENTEVSTNENTKNDFRDVIARETRPTHHIFEHLRDHIVVAHLEITTNHIAIGIPLQA